MINQSPLIAKLQKLRKIEPELGALLTQIINCQNKLVDEVNRNRVNPSNTVDVIRSANGLSLQVKQGANNNPWIWVEITGKTLIDGSTTRWQYSWKRKRRTLTGFVDHEDGLQGTSDQEFFVINSVEANNTTDSWGIGVDAVADAPDGGSLTLRDLSNNANPILPCLREFLQGPDGEFYEYFTVFMPNGFGVSCTT